MTIEYVRELWNACHAADEPHNCPGKSGVEFLDCEVCSNAFTASLELRHCLFEIVGLLLAQDDAIRSVIEGAIGGPNLTAVLLGKQKRR